MSSTASTSKAPETAKDTEMKNEAQAHLGVLEEDDEFEEFPVAGEINPNSTRKLP